MTRFNTLRVRLTGWYVVLLGLVLLAFSALLYTLLEHGLQQQVDQGLQVAATGALGALTVEQGRPQLQNGESENDFTLLGERGLLVRVGLLDGQIVASRGPFQSVPVPPAALTAVGQGQAHFATLAGAGRELPVRLYTLPYVAGARVVGFVQVGQSLQPTQDSLHQLLWLLLLGVPLTLGLTSLGGLFLADRALGPIDRITRAAQRISAEDLSRRLNLPPSADEVGRLAATFDAMLVRLDTAFQLQRRFAADASHELRTPLAIIKGNIGVALQRSRSAAEYQQVLTDLDDEVDRLTRLVEDLLLLARADSGHPLLHLEPLDLADLLQVVVDQVRPLAAARGIGLTLQNPPAVPMLGDPDKLLRLFLNLLDNAIKYTPAGGQITVRAAGTAAGITVTVQDSGLGMPAEQLAHIFERFYRADAARSRVNGGSGLGLAIAQWIVQAHNGQIVATSQIGAGSTFAVQLPYALPPVAGHGAAGRIPVAADLPAH
ncbi:MAG: ATP-binding protein [Chloroflexota bacterium]|nr:ATP-binding protein [Chloroflexota bacterium]